MKRITQPPPSVPTKHIYINASRPARRPIYTPERSSLLGRDQKTQHVMTTLSKIRLPVRITRNDQSMKVDSGVRRGIPHRPPGRIPALPDITDQLDGAVHQRGVEPIANGVRHVQDVPQHQDVRVLLLARTA